MTPRYIIMSASAQMPSSCWGRYGKLALVETDGEKPTMISPTARHMVRIIDKRDKLHMGGPQSAYQVAWRELNAKLFDLLRDEIERLRGGTPATNDDITPEMRLTLRALAQAEVEVQPDA
jgi:hypothetical protein